MLHSFLELSGSRVKLFQKGKIINLRKFCTKAVQKRLYKQPFMIGLAIYASVGYEAQEQNQNIRFRQGILMNTGCLQ